MLGWWFLCDFSVCIRFLRETFDPCCVRSACWALDSSSAGLFSVPRQSDWPVGRCLGRRASSPLAFSSPPRLSSSFSWCECSGETRPSWTPNEEKQRLSKMNSGWVRVYFGISLIHFTLRKLISKQKIVSWMASTNTHSGVANHFKTSVLRKLHFLRRFSVFN